MSKLEQIKVKEEVPDLDEIHGHKIFEDDDGSKYIIGRRYSRAQRFQHWSNVLLMVILMVTGFEIYLGNFPLGGVEFTQVLHVWAGFAVFTISFFLYTFILIFEKRVKEVLFSARDAYDLAVMTLCLLGIFSDDRYPHYDFYDPKKGKFVNKYHPAQRGLATANYIMLFIISMSGFALYEQVLPGKWPILNGLVIVGNAIMAVALNIGLSYRFVHFLVFAYFVISTGIHFYYTVLPYNRERFRGMATGHQRVKYKWYNPKKRFH